MASTLRSPDGALARALSIASCRDAIAGIRPLLRLQHSLRNFNQNCAAGGDGAPTSPRVGGGVWRHTSPTNDGQNVIYSRLSTIGRHRKTRRPRCLLGGHAIVTAVAGNARRTRTPPALNAFYLLSLLCLPQTPRHAACSPHRACLPPTHHLHPSLYEHYSAAITPAYQQRAFCLTTCLLLRYRHASNLRLPLHTRRVCAAARAAWRAGFVVETNGRERLDTLRCSGRNCDAWDAR